MYEFVHGKDVVSRETDPAKVAYLMLERIVDFAEFILYDIEPIIEEKSFVREAEVQKKRKDSIKNAKKKVDTK